MALVTAEDLRLYTGVVVEGDRLKAQEMYVNSALETVEGYLGYGLAFARRDATLDGNGEREIQLRARPISSVLRVSLSGQDVPPEGFEASGEFLVRRGGFFPAGRGNVRAVYEAGFSPPGGPGPELPGAIKGAVLRIAALLQTESEGNIGLTGKSFGEGGSRTFVSFTNFDKYLSPISNWKLIRI